MQIARKVFSFAGFLVRPTPSTVQIDREFSRNLRSVNRALRAYRKRHEEEEAVFVESPMKLSESELTTIKSLVGADESARVIVRANQSLLNGIQVAYKGRLAELTFENRLERLKSSFVNL